MSPADSTGPGGEGGLMAALTGRAEAILSGNSTEWSVPPTADAATVILLRDGDSGPQTLLQRRVGTMKFAAGMYVFPGGRVEIGDTAGSVPWQAGIRDEPFVIDADSGLTSSFRAIAVAAARETWEESGVVLAVSERGEPIGTAPHDESADVLEWLRQSGAAVDGAAMRPWVHWVTPEVERHRYDTRFLVAAIPAGQQAHDLGQESTESVWSSPTDALELARTGSMPMLPPTVDALQQLARFSSVSEILLDADSRVPEPLLPRPVRAEDGGIEWVLADAYTGEVLKRW